MSGGGEHDSLINPVAEAALLGAMLRNPDLVEQLSDHVRPDDFGYALHGRIFSAMQRLAAKGKRSSATTLRPIFATDSDAQYGDYLDTLVDQPGLDSSADLFADQIAELAGRRQLRQALKDAMTSLTEDFDKPVEEISGTVEATGWAAAKRGAIDPVYTSADLGRLVLARDDRIVSNPSAIGMLNDLVPDIDKALGPLEPATYNIIAARPGMGKTALADSLAIGYAMRGHAGCAINLEMTAEQLGIRTSANLAYHLGFDIPHKRFKEGNLTPDERAYLRKTVEHQEALPLRYINPGRCDIRKVWSLVAQQKAIWQAAGRRLEFVTVDYLQLLGATGTDGRQVENDTQRVNTVSKTLKDMAADLGVALIALAQLSRTVEQRPNKRPNMADLKNSGDIEQDADSVTLLYREEFYLERDKPKLGEKGKDGKDLYEEWSAQVSACRNKMDLIVDKNRHGSTSTRTIKFLPVYSACRGSDFDPFLQDTQLFD